MKTINLLFISILIFSKNIYSKEIYKSYDEYYKSLDYGIFKKYNSNETAKIVGNELIVGDIILKLSKSVNFPGEISINDDIGNRAKVFRENSIICIDGISPSSSGTAVRHKSAYLIDLRSKRNIIFYKMPGLFFSCFSVHVKDNNILFYSVEYRYEENNDLPYGIIFIEYVIDGSLFKKTGNEKVAYFQNIENVWSFEIR